jgi:hypothetical protein
MSEVKQIPSPEKFLESRGTSFDNLATEPNTMREYIKEVVKYTLSTATERAEVGGERFMRYVDKQSILSLEQEIIKDLKL